MDKRRPRKSRGNWFRQAPPTEAKGLWRVSGASIQLFGLHLRSQRSIGSISNGKSIGLSAAELDTATLGHRWVRQANRFAIIRLLPTAEGDGMGGALNRSGVDPPLSSSRACLTTFIANSVP